MDKLKRYGNYLNQTTVKEIKETVRNEFIYKEYDNDKYYLAPFYKKFMQEKFGKKYITEIIESKIIINGKKINPIKFIKDYPGYIRYYICSVAKETVKVENNIVTYTQHTRTKELAHTKANFTSKYILENEFHILDIAVKVNFITDLQIIQIVNSDNLITDYKQDGNVIFFYTIKDDNEIIYKTYEVMPDGTLNEKEF